MRQADWASGRTDDELRQLMENTPVQLGVWEGDRLVGYARALTDGRFRALIDDVVVDERQRGSGIGTEMMRRLIERLVAVDQVFLLASDTSVAFYSKLGFELTRANCLVRRRPAG
jgi:ribosomal protein S18 acetylase RimI-like enzyme